MENSISLLEKLPCSILECVCGFLNLTELLNLRFTNRYLHDLVQSFSMKIKIVIGASRNASYTNMRIVKPINFDNEIEKMKKLHSVIASNKWKVVKITVNLTKTQKTDPKIRTDMTTKLHSLLEIFSQTLTYLHVEATASYENGPFQEIQPITIISLCHNLEYLHLNGRKLTKLYFWEIDSPLDVKEGPNRFETKLRCLKLEHIEPCGLPNLIEASPTLEQLSVLFYGDFPPIDYATFQIWHESDTQFLTHHKPMCNLRSINIIGLIPINLHDLMNLAPNLCHFQLNLDGLDEDNKERVYLSESLPLILSRLPQNKVTSLNLSTLERDHFSSIFKFKVLRHLSLQLDSNMVKLLANLVEISSLGLEKLEVVISTAVYKQEATTYATINEKDVVNLINAIGHQYKSSLKSFTIQFFNYPGDFFSLSRLDLKMPMFSLVANCQHLEFLQLQKHLYTSKKGIMELREIVNTTACEDSSFAFCD